MAVNEPCADCVQATLTAWHAFRAGCPGCAARAVSRGPNFARCRALGAQDRRYRDELELLKVTHAQVIEAAKADQLAREVKA